MYVLLKALQINSFHEIQLLNMLLLEPFFPQVVGSTPSVCSL